MITHNEEVGYTLKEIEEIYNVISKTTYFYLDVTIFEIQDKNKMYYYFRQDGDLHTLICSSGQRVTL